jgi:Asp-tRNA(Asn)/Glu-tRNA(Gln) amidotransferase A subunit family amidase
MSDDLCYLSATEAITRFKSKRLSPVELMRAVIERSENVEPQINAFTDEYFEEALAQAAQAEARYRSAGSDPRPLEGIPLAVKDEFDIQGQRTTSGSLLFQDEIAQTTSPCIERLLNAGAIVHARTTTPEFPSAFITHSRLWGVTRNPWNLEYTPGGSSGGSAAALAAGTTTLATGSDIGGSIRAPASCCGVVGFKPPYGRVPEEPPFNLDSYCANGPMARTVADCALLENLMAGPHSLDISSLRPKLEIPSPLQEIQGWRIAYSLDLDYCAVEPDVIENTKAALDVFRDLGCTLEEVHLGWSWKTLEAAHAHLGHLMANAIGRELPDSKRDSLTDYVRAFIKMGEATSVYDFIGAADTAGEMYETLGPVLDRFNVFVCPTTALAAVPADFDSTHGQLQINGVDVDPFLGWGMTYPFNVMGRCPVMSVPSGHVQSGVPSGIQIVGQPYDDVSVFRAATAYEKARGWLDTPERRPAL